MVPARGPLGVSPLPTRLPLLCPMQPAAWWLVARQWMSVTLVYLGDSFVLSVHVNIRITSERLTHPHVHVYAVQSCPSLASAREVLSKVSSEWDMHSAAEMWKSIFCRSLHNDHLRTS